MANTSSQEPQLVGAHVGARSAQESSETDYLLGESTRSANETAAPALGSAGGRKDSWTGYDEFAGLPWFRRPSFLWLVGPYALFALAFGVSMVPKLNLFVDLVCREYLADRGLDGLHVLPVVLGGKNPQCQIPGVQRSVATFMLAISVIVGSLSALTVPRLGSLSDRFGRKKILALTMCGGLTVEVTTLLAANFPDTVNYRWILVASVLDGLVGSFTMTNIVSHSYTSDCTPPSKRTITFGYLHACLFTSMAFGPLLSGYFVKWTGSLLSIFYVTLVCHSLFVLFIIFVLPESLSERRQNLAREKHAKEKEMFAAKLREAELQVSEAETSGLWTQKTGLVGLYRRTALRVQQSHPLAPLKILLPKGVDRARVRRNLIILATVDTLIIASAMSLGPVTLLYSEFMFHWGNFETSAFISLVSMVRVVVLMVIFPLVNYFVRVRPAARRQRLTGEVQSEANRGADRLDVWLIRSAVFADVVGLAGYVFARTPAAFVLCGVVTALGGVGSATIQSSLTKHIPPDRVGQLLGAVGLLHAVSRIIAPLVFNGLYAATIGSYPQAIFVLVSSMTFLVFLLTFFVRPFVYLVDSPAVVNDETTATPSARVVDEQANALVDDEVLQQI
ncbi:hypothetical protein SEPCBS119000_003488 [Sporothrix epigloea]|uniref:Major facilitator superfamily (MFS) profile domain-containing protein n=1 Tax=Sporothrix epigloea TaxID=1892477 RepID=A0ABP0DN57_9PEZI